VRRLLAILLLCLTPMTAARAEPAVFSDLLVVSGCVNFAPPVLLVGGMGSFAGLAPCNSTFSAVPNVCTIVSDGETLPEGPETCDAYLYGTFISVACGWMTMDGTMTITSGSDRETIQFVIQVVQGVGTVTGASSSEDAVDTWAGTASWVPTAPLVPPCPVTQARVTFNLVAVD
jgi:hypothetical protein